MATYKFPSELSSGTTGDQPASEGQNNGNHSGDGQDSFGAGSPDESSSGTQGAQESLLSHDAGIHNAHPVPQPAPGTPPSATPALDFNGYVLYAAEKAVPQEHYRVLSGTSVAEPGAVYDEESGRMYHNHGTGRYFFPNDPAEQDRLDLQHHMLTLLLDHRLHCAPVQSPKHVLDIATGTGIWAIQFAKQHPDATVTGTDLSLIQPPADALPPNVAFVKENSETDEWVFPHPFDFIFLRLVYTCFDDYPALVRRCFAHLAPGGWLEFDDSGFGLLCTDGTLEGTAWDRWTRLILRAGALAGRDFHVAKKYKQWLLEAGFVDVVERTIPVPVGPWPSDPKFQDVGRWHRLNVLRGLRGICWKLFRSLGMTPEEIEDIVEKTKADLHNTSIHSSHVAYIVYGRKPYPGETVQPVQ